MIFESRGIGPLLILLYLQSASIFGQSLTNEDGSKTKTTNIEPPGVNEKSSSVTVAPIARSIDVVSEKYQAKTNLASSDQVIYLLNALIELQNHSNTVQEQSRREKIEFNNRMESYLREINESLKASSDLSSNLSLKLSTLEDLTKNILYSSERSTAFQEALNPAIKIPSVNSSNQRKKHEAVPSNSTDVREIDATRALHAYLHSKLRESLRIRPAKPGQRIVVNVDVNINQIMEVNEAEGYIKLNLILNNDYRNDYLQWNWTENGIYGTIIDPKNELWMPDIIPFNGVDLKNDKHYVQTQPAIMSTGWILYSQPRIVKFTCSFNNYYFPFDYQICVLTFRSWVHDWKEIYIQPVDGLFDYDSYQNDEWEILNITQFGGFIHHLDYYLSTYYDSKYSVYEKHILLKRRPLYYIVNLLIPAVFVSQVAFFGFFTAASSEGDRTEKVNLGMGTLLAMSVLLLTTSGMTTISSRHIPVIGTFFLVNIVLICVGIIMTSSIMAVHQRGKRQKRVPRWVRSIFLFGLAPRIGFKIPNVIRGSRSLQYEPGPDNDVINESSENDRNVDLALDELPQLKKLRTVIDTGMDESRRNLAEEEYIFLAKILDAIMLILFSVILYVCVGCVLLVGIAQRPPAFSERKAVYKNPYFETDYPERYVNETMKLLDFNQDGAVDVAEIETAKKNCKMTECVTHFVESRVRYSDFNDDGETSRDELTSLLAKTEMYTEVNDTVTSAFDSADRNLDKQLVRDEFESFIKLAQKDNYGPSDAKSRDKWFHNLDQNGDDFINLVEICVGYHLLPYY